MNINDIIGIITENISITKEITGLIIYTIILFFITSITYKKSLILTLLLMIPITLLFFRFKLLDGDIVALFIVISILGLALATRQVIK